MTQSVRQGAAPRVRFGRLPVCLLVGLTLQAQAVPAPRKIQTLIITGQDRHPWKEMSPYLKQVLEQTGKFEVRVAEEFRGATIDSLSPYDVAILVYSDEKLTTPSWSETTKMAMLQFVREGKGLVVYHHSAASFQNWDEYQKLAGCVWNTLDSHHSPVHDYQVGIPASEHPITRGMAPFMARTDELYAGLRCEASGYIHVLASGWDDHALYANKPGAATPPGPSQNEPLIWTVQYGHGRVFATMLGNDLRATQTVGFIATFTRGTEWAATGDVTIPLPSELRR